MKGFATYRLPDSSETVRIEGEVVRINYLEEITEQQGYLVAPFDIDRHGILLIKPDVVTRQPANSAPAADSFREYTVVHETMYEPAFHTFHEAVKNGPFHKLVLSRSVRICIGMQDSELMFRNACSRYPHQMVTLFSTCQSGTWLIITPETLLTVSSDRICHTMALAGTMPADCGYEWSEKNRQEQKVVSDYISLAISPFTSDSRITGAYSASAGGVQHLRTDFEFSIKKSITIGDILKALHPTPAVCGMPKDKAFAFINRNEGYDREYYSGFSGPLNINEQSQLYVTLRCARIDGQYATLYAGGGIMPESELRSEELETRLKMETVKGLF